jgi:hypothetical protein
MKTKIKKQTSENKMWLDEKGITCPYSRLTKSEKLKETEAYELAKKALKLEDDLKELKNRMIQSCTNVYAEIAKENNSEKENKGNMTFFNFDRTIKVEKNINEKIDFDVAMIEMAKKKLDSFLEKGLKTVDEFIKALVDDAFTNTKGRLDTKKVMSLLKHESRIDHEDFQEAMSLIKKAISRPSSKEYYRISLRNDNGQYDVIDLNFSNL